MLVVYNLTMSRIGELDMSEINQQIMVIGHKNPDTDSICSALCYANLKRIITGEQYVAKRAGHLNDETKYILKKLKVKSPEYIKDVRPQVRDIEIRRISGVSRDISVRRAWTIMKDSNVVTLPITKGDKLEGLVTIGDIARSYFEIYDSTILSTAKTSFHNIIETLEGNVLTGDSDQIFDKGKVVIAVANPDQMENYINDGDIVILSNRYEAQLCAIEMNAKCIVVCEGAKVSQTIMKIASEHNCMIIGTKYDTYTVARLINQSMPIRFFMKENAKLVKFTTNDFIEDIRDIMTKKRFRDFPIEDEHHNFVGMISRRNLLKAGKKKLILVDHNEKTQAVAGVETAEIMEIIDHHRIGSIETVLPVYFRNQPVGCTATIVFQMYQENHVEIDKQIASLLASAIISDTLILRSPTCTQVDRDVCQYLAGIAGIDIEQYGKEIFRAGSNLGSKTAKELFYQDYKTFAVNEFNIGVGQINSMNEDEIEDIMKKMPVFMESVIDGGINQIYFMLTNIITESSYVFFAGKGAENVLENAFNIKTNDHYVLLKGVVSRKKQLVPSIIEAIQQ